METIFRDLRYGARMLLKKPGFTLIAVITIALGVGATTATFSVVNALLFRPLPFRDPGRLVWIANTGHSGLSGATTRVGSFQEWRKLNQSFQDLAAYFAFFDYGSYTMTGMGDPERLSGVGVSGNFLSVLGVQPMLGRGFVDDECKWNGKKAVILGNSFWQRRFGSDAGVIGRSITLNGQPTTIVGVMPASFDFASVFSPGSKVDMVMPFPITEETDKWGNTLAVIGRLKTGASVQNAQAEFDVIDQQLYRAHPERGQFGAKLSSLQEQISRGFRLPFLVLLGAVACVLLIACANVSNLLLARASGRRKEIAVRVALGAGKGRLVAQMLTESLMLSFCGAALGLPLAFAATHLVASTQAVNLPLLQTVGVDWTAMFFTLIVAVSTGLLFGIVPALQTSRLDVHETLKDAGRGLSDGKRKAWVRGALVVSEVALSCVLLIGAGLLIRSFLRLMEVDPGFRPEHAAAWRVDLGPKYQTDAQRIAFLEQLVKNVEAIPGVESAGLTDTLPLGRNRSWVVAAKGETYAQGQYPVAFPRLVDAGYIRTMKIPLRAGREFTEQDTADAKKVVVINETMAHRLWPGRNAIGQIAMIDGSEWQVAGVVGDVRHSALDEQSGMEMYLLMAQIGPGAADMVVRATLPIESLVPSVRAVLGKADPDLPSTAFQTLDGIVDRAVSPKRFVTMILGGFAALALVMASLGIYGVISYSVNQRTSEIGIRMALGAQSFTVLRMVVGQGMKMALAGVAAGLVTALALTRLMSSLLFGVKATDPLTFGGISVLLVLVALLACYVPAQRATKVDAMVALRYE